MKKLNKDNKSLSFPVRIGEWISTILAVFDFFSKKLPSKLEHVDHTSPCILLHMKDPDTKDITPMSSSNLARKIILEDPSDIANSDGMYDVKP
mmetsp:Transcript_3264/g.4874  ORF Transcript_3264/g.4874 Transcript_3264/m.4874 type:complete len:93 (+) Transcript_3264:1302-1580(+)